MVTGCHAVGNRNGGKSSVRRQHLACNLMWRRDRRLSLGPCHDTYLCVRLTKWKLGKKACAENAETNQKLRRHRPTKMKMRRQKRRSSLILAAIGASTLYSPPPFANALSTGTAPSTATTGTCRAAFPGSQPTTEHDKSVLRRQTGQTAPAEAAIGVPSTCSCCHGFPRAFAMDPFPANGRRINSGLVKLSCPHLVRAVDELEDEGGICSMNDIVKDSEELRRSMVLTHELHAKVRRDMLEDVDAKMNGDDDDDDEQAVGAMSDILRQKLGERGAEAFLSSGVAGSSAGSTDDVKCLHAWLGDYLFRGATEDCKDDTANVPTSIAMGRAVAQTLKERGVDISGTESCRSLCDPSSNAAPLPPRPRNKQRLKTGKEIERRKRRRKEDEAEQQQEA